MEKITCNNGDVIFANGFDVEGYELFYIQEACNNNGYHRFYTGDDGVLIYDSDKGWTGFWSDDVGLTMSEFFGAYENDDANYYLDIDADDYFPFAFNDLAIITIENEPKLVANVPLHDSYYDKNVVFCIEDKRTYEIKTFYDNDGIEIQKATEIEVYFNCYYVGSANREIWWVEATDELIDLSYKELVAKKEELEYEWSDYAFYNGSEYIVVDEIAECIVTEETIANNNCNCLEII